MIQGCKASVIPSDGSVTSIGSYAFSWCDSLTSVTIPDSVESIDYKAFYECTSFTTVYYGGTEEQWEEMMRDNAYGTEDKSYVGVKIIFEK